MKLILEKAMQHWEIKLPFVLYKKPNDALITGFFQINDTLFFAHDFTEKGFVFATFDGKQTLLIPENQSEIICEAGVEIQSKRLHDADLPSDELDRNRFESLVTKGIQAIKQGQFKKVVLSRKETVNTNRFDLLSSFQNLVLFYPDAFTYCFYHPKVGVWLGASPEQLLKSKGNFFKTIALAGTQKNIDFQDIVWKNKEMEEQQFVTDYIVNTLNGVAENVVISKPYSFKAGALWHIKTDISGKLNSSFGLQKIVRLLHPTPAVCGFPKDKSKDFILENEDYDRTFYTGFLGELHYGDTEETDHSDLFVNLRCMEIVFSNIQNDFKSAVTKAILYVGCGVTKDSIPAKEWQESVNKSMTMKRVLNF